MKTQARESVATLLAVAASVPPDKQALVAMVAEAFANGMKAQQELVREIEGR